MLNSFDVFISFSIISLIWLSDKLGFFTNLLTILDDISSKVFLRNSFKEAILGTYSPSSSITSIFENSKGVFLVLAIWFIILSSVIGEFIASIGIISEMSFTFISL